MMIIWLLLICLICHRMFFEWIAGGDWTRMDWTVLAGIVLGGLGSLDWIDCIWSIVRGMCSCHWDREVMICKSDGISSGIWIGWSSVFGRASVDCVIGSVVCVCTGWGCVLELRVLIVYILYTDYKWVELSPPERGLVQTLLLWVFLFLHGHPQWDNSIYPCVCLCVRKKLLRFCSNFNMWFLVEK